MYHRYYKSCVLHLEAEDGSSLAVFGLGGAVIIPTSFAGESLKGGFYCGRGGIIIQMETNERVR